MNFPRLKYPIKTKGLSSPDELILLAYDMIWRAQDKLPADIQDMDYVHDMVANLSNLGYHIEHNIAKGDAESIFELENYQKEGIFSVEEASAQMSLADEVLLRNMDLSILSQEELDLK